MAVDTAQKRFSLLNWGHVWAPLYPPDTTIEAPERATLLRLYSGIPLGEPVEPPVTEAEAAGGGPGGRKRRRQSRYPRWVLIDGARHRVKSAEEERQLLEAYQQRLEAERAALEAQSAPQAEIAPLRVKVARVERRIDAVDEREAEWKAKLRRIDSELVLLLG